MTVWRDGAFVPAMAAISADDRGYLIGDAIFETLLVENGRPAFLDRHLARLGFAAGVWGMPAPPSADAVRRAVARLAREADVKGPAACRVTMSRTGGGRGLGVSPETRTQTVIGLSPTSAPIAPLAVILAEHRRWAGSPTNGFKCAGGYAPNILARAEATAARADDAVMMNERGRIACATAANIFVIDGESVLTPPVEEGAMPGITRAVVLEEARALGLPVAETPIERSRLNGSTILLTNSIIGITPCKLAGAAVPENSTATSLIAAYRRRLGRAFGDDI